jgi:hypothetical protein
MSPQHNSASVVFFRAHDDMFPAAGGGKLSFSLTPSQPLSALGAAAAAMVGEGAGFVSAVVVMDDHVYDALDEACR